MREQKLRADVEMFAQRLHTDPTSAEDQHGAEDQHDLNGTTGEDLQVLRFPVELTPKERKVVHAMAESLGLQSHSNEDGPNGERCVSICRPGPLGGAAEVSQRRNGKRPKMTRSQWKQHCKALEEGRS